MMQAGKGDRYRPVDNDKFNKNFDKIFRKRKGRRSTILTGPLGVEEEAETEKKTLLGS